MPLISIIRRKLLLKLVVRMRHAGWETCINLATGARKANLKSSSDSLIILMNSLNISSVSRDIEQD